MLDFWHAIKEERLKIIQEIRNL